MDCNGMPLEDRFLKLASRTKAYFYVRTGDFHAAQDLWGDVVLSFAKNQALLERNHTDLEHWVSKVAKNRLRRQKRDEKPGHRETQHHNIDEYEAELAEDPTDDLLEEIVAEDRKDLLHSAFAQLTPSEKEIIELRDYSELSYAEISHITAQAPGTLMTRHARTLQKLKRLMSISEESD